MVWLLNLALIAPAYAGGEAWPSPDTTAAPKVSFEGIPDSASVRPKGMGNKPHQVHARLLTDKSHVQPGETFRLGLHLEQDEGWHTYWKSPGSVGKPTEILWTLPEGAKSSPYAYPAPMFFEQMGIVSIGYDEEVLFFTEVSLPESQAAGTITLSAKADWLVCKESCIP